MFPAGRRWNRSARPAPNGASRCGAEQCRHGWHLDNEPIIPARQLDDWQTWLFETRADYQQHRDQAAGIGADTAELDGLLAELDDELAKTGIRGKPDPSSRKTRRHRSTRRRQDAPDLRRKKIAARTTGKVYTVPSGEVYRPSMFVTLTLDSYGQIGEDGTLPTPALTTTGGPRATRCMRPATLADLWHDLRAATAEIRPDWDLGTPRLREAWVVGDYSFFHGWGRRSVEPLPTTF